jgi:hypothetical protein
MTQTVPVTGSTTPTARLRRHWPAVAGVVFAGLVVFDLSRGVDLAPVLAASAVI